MGTSTDRLCLTLLTIQWCFVIGFLWDGLAVVHGRCGEGRGSPQSLVTNTHLTVAVLFIVDANVEAVILETVHCHIFLLHASFMRRQFYKTQSYNAGSWCPQIPRLGQRIH